MSRRGRGAGAPISIGVCPVCRTPLAGRVTRVLKNVVFCSPCSFDIEAEGTVDQHVETAKRIAKR